MSLTNAVVEQKQIGECLPEESFPGECFPERQSYQRQLSLKASCDAVGKTILKHRYMAYPLSVSPVFRLEENGTADAMKQAYLYRMNTSPGLLAGDRLGVSLQLATGSQLYLADQSAMKVHTMPKPGTRATVNYEIEVGDRATLEFLPEPLILFAEAALSQTTEITVHPTAGLSLGEIILPGRLARGEVYQFREYESRMRVRSPEGTLWFAETMKLLGKGNPFAASALFASGPVLGTLVLILPAAIATPNNLTTLGTEIESWADVGQRAHPAQSGSVELASSILPGGRGLFVRAIAKTTRELRACFRAALNSVRTLRQEAALPYSL